MIADTRTAPLRSLTRLLDRFAEALTGPRRHASVVQALLAYGAIWLVYRLISTLPRDIHYDMSELYAWSLTPAFGYEKHPPLSAFVVHLWFELFPVDGWSFLLMTMLNIVITLYIAWCILARWADPAKAAFGLALLMVIPFYNFQALKYNANTVLLPVWAFTAYAFLRAVETRQARWAILAGAAAGAAMLGKYWSIFLVAGFVIAAVIDRRRRAFFLSPAPYLMVAAGGIVLAPHLLWITNHGDTLAYASRRLDDHMVFSLGSALVYVGGIVGYSSIALILWGALLRPSAAAIRDTVAPAEPQRQLALWCFLLPNVLPMLAARWAGFQLTPLWTLPGYTLLPLVLLTSPQVAISRLALRWVIGIAAAVSLGALLASPLVALVLHVRAEARPNDYGSLLARDVGTEWKAMTDQPLTAIYTCGASPDVANAVAFDLRLPPRVMFGKPGLAARADLLQRGGAIVGAADDPDCAVQGATITAMRPATRPLAKTYRPILFGVQGAPFSYMAYIVPPP